MTTRGGVGVAEGGGDVATGGVVVAEGGGSNATGGVAIPHRRRVGANSETVVADGVMSLHLYRPTEGGGGGGGGGEERRFNIAGGKDRQLCRV